MKSRGKAFSLLFLLMTISFVHFLMPIGGHPEHLVHILARKLFLVPILMAAVWYELPGGLAAGAAVSLIYSSHALISWKGQIGENLNQFAEILTFLLAGAGTGVFVRLEKKLKAEVEKERARADVDPLTGLLSRSYFESHFRSELERAGLHGYPLSVCLIDLDHLKRINDQHGHLAGDGALRHLADRIREVKRETDIAIRFGGDEFLVLLPGMIGYDALEWSEKLRNLLEETPFRPGGSSQTVKVSAGAGVAEYRPESDSAEALIRRADEDLYERKRERKP